MNSGSMPSAEPGRNSARKTPKRKAKVQAAFEFITSYGWAILILAVIMVLLYYFIGVPNSAAPNQCSFSFGANCRGLIVTSYNSLTSLTFVITNSQQSPLLNPTMKVATDSYGNASASCEPANILAPSGSYIICNLNLPDYALPGATVIGSFYLNATACPNNNINNCQPAQSQTFAGSFISRATTQRSIIHLTSTTVTTLTSTSTSTSSTTSVSTTTTSTSTTSITVPPSLSINLDPVYTCVEKTCTFNSGSGKWSCITNPATNCHNRSQVTLGDVNLSWTVSNPPPATTCAVYVNGANIASSEPSSGNMIIFAPAFVFLHGSCNYPGSSSVTNDIVSVSCMGTGYSQTVQKTDYSNATNVTQPLC